MAPSHSGWIDPEYPADRIAFYAKDSQARVIVSEEGLPDDLVPDGATRILADKDPRTAAAPATNPDSGVTGEDLAGPTVPLPPFAVRWLVDRATAT